MKKKPQVDITPEDIGQMARDIGKRPPESLTKRVMERMRQIDREVAEGKREPLPQQAVPEKELLEKEKDRTIGRGRGDEDDD